MRSWKMLGAVGLVFLAGCTSSGRSPGTSVTPAGEIIAADERLAAPELSGELLDGREFESQVTGSVTLINFWGSWCGPCRVEVPELEKLAEANQYLGVAVLGVNVRDNTGQARRFLADRGITYPSLDDSRGEIVSKYNEFPVYQTPSTLIIDESGRVAASYLGPISPNELQRAIDQLLTE